MDSGHIIMPLEAEAIVEATELIKVKDIGCQSVTMDKFVTAYRWVLQHENLEKLNIQAAVSASTQGDEFVKEFLITHDKIPLLVQELIATETWKENAFPQFIQQGLEPKVSFPMYMVLYHEATVVNLLETVLYHRDACEAMEDSALDLLDYCNRKLTILLSKQYIEEDMPSSDLSNLEELQRQKSKLDFDICIKAVSIIRYITDHFNVLPLSVTRRALNTHDIPLLLVQLVDSPPWTREKDGKLEKYIDNKWHKVSHADRFQLTKLEGQIWLSLYQLLMNEDCQKRYELDSYRKNVILKLRGSVSEILVDQLPILGDLQRYVEQLSLMEPPAAKQELVIEQVPEVRENILKTYKGQWKKLARSQFNSYFNPKEDAIRKDAHRLAETYDMAMLESLITEPPKCAVCGEEATKRCSRCQNEWYCRRECQVGHWKKHKKACDLLVESLSKIKDNANTVS